jgi:hypothetical protein
MKLEIKDWTKSQSTGIKINFYRLVANWATREKK